MFIISGCSRNNNDDFDFTNFKPLPKKKELIKDKAQDIAKTDVNNKLIPLSKRDEVIPTIKYGKNDPFSSLENESNQTISYLRVKGFISIGNKNFAFIKFLNEEGVININSVGGLNTKLLPNKAIVTDINPLKEEINISIEGVDYSLKLASI